MIVYNEKQKYFNLSNKYISYIMNIMDNGQIGHLYYGNKISENISVSHMFRQRGCILAPCTYRNNLDFSLELMRQEYPAYGTGDYREPAYQLRMKDGSRITNFIYKTHKIYSGKKKLEGLPATFGDEKDVTTLDIILEDSLINCQVILSYSIFEDLPVIVRSANFINMGDNDLYCFWTGWDGTGNINDTKPQRILDHYGCVLSPSNAYAQELYLNHPVFSGKTHYWGVGETIQDIYDRLDDLESRS